MKSRILVLLTLLCVLPLLVVCQNDPQSSASPTTARVLPTVDAAKLGAIDAQTVEFSKAGSATPDLENLDQAIGRIMEDYQVPGGAFAMAKDGRLIHARGYGVACKENREAVQSDSLFRIASVSKPITAVAVLKLVEDGRLSLDDRAFQIVGHLQPLEGKEVDPRLRDITIRHLLEHSAGWDRDRSFDPLYSPATTRHLSDGRLPASCEAITRYMMGRRLDFPPGTEHAYSNLGYCVLGLIIEEVSGLPYETYVQTEVLAAMGIKRMRVGGSLLQERYEGEVCYYDYPGAGSSRSVFPNEPNLVPQPYGSMYLEATAANGGWIASAVDLVRFVLSVDGHPMPPDILHPETIHLMVSLPDLPDWRDSDYYYALGWEISSDDRGRIWSHDGAMPGTRSLLAVRSDGYAIALLFNSDPKSGGDFMGEVVETIRQTVDGQTGWPTYDLFPQYYHNLQ